MITSWDIYWITRLDSLQPLFGLTAMALALATIMLAFHASISSQWGEMRRWIVVTTISTVMFIVLAILTPSTKEYAAIYLLPKIANNKQVQKLPDNAIKFLNAKMEAWINDLGSKEDKERMRQRR